MNEESIYLLQILKCFIQDKKPESFQGDWKKLIQLAEIHSVTGILGYMVKKYPDESNAKVSLFLKQKCFSTISIFSRKAECMKLLIQKMNEAKINHLLFKGYVIKDYYPVPELRTFGDIDFLIPLEERQKSNDLMMKEGFTRKNDWEPVYSYFRQSEYYEIHTNVMEVDISDKADYRGYYKHIWEHAHVSEGYTWELSPEYHLIYLLTHIAKHIRGSGAGIRMYMDIAVFIQHFGKQLNWDFIRKELKTLKLTDFANMVLNVVQNYFEIESPMALKKVKDDVMQDFMNFTMEGGVFGHFGRDAGLVALKSQDRNQETISRFKTCLNRLFPNALDLEKRYTYLQRKHWLLPVAWIHRMIRTKDKWNLHVNEVKSIIITDKEEVLKLKRIYKEIGL